MSKGLSFPDNFFDIFGFKREEEKYEQGPEGIFIGETLAKKCKRDPELAKKVFGGVPEWTNEEQEKRTR